MWLNKDKATQSAISQYKKQLLQSNPKYVVIDNLFNHDLLTEIANVLQQPSNWQTQRHTYDELYVNDAQWYATKAEQRFVQRDVFKPLTVGVSHLQTKSTSLAESLLNFLRSSEFMAFLSSIFNIEITDIHVEDPAINTNYFRLSTKDFVGQHADDSPGRVVCLLLYLNTQWDKTHGGELVFLGEEKFSHEKTNHRIAIAPLFNRCVIFDPSSKGSEHWVNPLNSKHSQLYRYNITSWYWSE